MATRVPLSAPAAFAVPPTPHPSASFFRPTSFTQPTAAHPAHARPRQPTHAHPRQPLRGASRPFRVRLDNLTAISLGGGTNVVAVYVDPDNGDRGGRSHGSGWWYEGGGLQP